MFWKTLVLSSLVLFAGSCGPVRETSIGRPQATELQDSRSSARPPDSKILRVTELSDEGQGSLRAALSQSGCRVIIFEVSGTIWLKSNLIIQTPCVTVAGQTAPAPGITLAGAGIVVQTEDVTLQHIRVRVGDHPQGPLPEHRDGIRIEGARRVLVDHCSISWAIDEGVSIANAQMVTIRNSIISENLSNSLHPKGFHSKGLLVREDARDVLLVRNLFAHNWVRNPTLGGGTSVAVINNLIYNAREWAISLHRRGDQPIEALMIGNALIAGPDTLDRFQPVLLAEDLPRGTRVIIRDNLLKGPGHFPEGPEAADASTFPEFDVLPVQEVEASVLGNVGARPLDPDQVDSRLLHEVRDRSGRIIDTPAEVGGWPRLPVRRRSLHPPANLHEVNGEGRSRLEEWLREFARSLENGS